MSSSSPHPYFFITRPCSVFVHSRSRSIIDCFGDPSLSSPATVLVSFCCTRPGTARRPRVRALPCTCWGTALPDRVTALVGGVRDVTGDAQATHMQYCPLTDVWGRSHTLGTQLQSALLQKILAGREAATTPHRPSASCPPTRQPRDGPAAPPRPPARPHLTRGMPRAHRPPARHGPRRVRVAVE